MSETSKSRRRTASGRGSYHHGDLRRALLSAAEAELAEHGPEGFTLRSCAKRAGVSHAAPAHHFGDAQGLLTELAAEGYERFRTVVDAHMDAARPDGHSRIVAAGMGYIAFARENPSLFRLMFSSKRPSYENAHLQEAASAAFAQLVEAVAAYAGPDPLSHPRGRQAVARAWAIAHGTADLLLSHGMAFLGAEDPETMRDNLEAVLRGSLPADPSVGA